MHRIQNLLGPKGCESPCGEGDEVEGMVGDGSETKHLQPLWEYVCFSFLGQIHCKKTGISDKGIWEPNRFMKNYIFL